jgi:DNA polymerase III, alpha subunit
VKPGVKLKVGGIEKEGPEYKIPNRMKKSEYLQKLQDKDKERAEYYKNIAEKGLLDPVEEEKSNRGISKAHTMLSKQLERLSEINRVIKPDIFLILNSLLRYRSMNKKNLSRCLWMMLLLILEP